MAKGRPADHATCTGTGSSRHSCGRHTAFSCPSRWRGSSDMAVNSWKVSCQNFLLGISCRTAAVSTGLLATTEHNSRLKLTGRLLPSMEKPLVLAAGKTFRYTTGTRGTRVRSEALLRRLANTERSALICCFVPDRRTKCFFCKKIRSRFTYPKPRLFALRYSLRLRAWCSTPRRDCEYPRVVSASCFFFY